MRYTNSREGISIDDDMEVGFLCAKLSDRCSDVEHDLVRTSRSGRRRYQNGDTRSGARHGANETDCSCIGRVARNEKLYTLERSRRERWGRFQNGSVDADNQAGDTRRSLTESIVRQLGGTGRHDGQRSQGECCKGAYNLRLAQVSGVHQIE
jgi:hypothetical protein